MNNINYIEKAIVTTIRTFDNKISRIIAFIKLEKLCNKTPKDIKENIKSILPEYMIPTIKIINEIPLTSNGKIDEKKLLESI